jgi:2-polyprenyl-6-methoxyphenol hydroxylase-like FAD-dependent oxidoreductase
MHAKADLVVGADGIRSSVRKLLIGNDISPLRYLGCIVILGICPLSALEGLNSPLLDSATVFQTANGNERIYIMPYTSDSVMWQLSFPMEEEEARH